MTLLAVIPCLNEVENIERITRQLISDEAVNAIAIVDGGSTDGTLDIVSSLIAESPKVSLIANPAKIQSAGVNAAVRSMSRDMTWLLRIDAHCAYPDDYVTRLLESAQQTGADCVVVPMKTVGREGFQIAIATAQNSIIGTGGSAHRGQSQGRLRQLVPLAVPCAALLLLLSPLHWLFAAPFLFWLGLCLGLGTIIGGRQAEAVGCLSGIAAAIMHFSWAIGFFKQIIFRPKGVAARYGFPAETSYNLD